MKTFKTQKDFFLQKKNDKETINSKDLTDKFSELINYLNDTAVTFINAINDEVVGGIDDAKTANFFLSNVGDGTTTWKLLTNDNLPNSTISFSKLIHATENSILAADFDKILKPITPTDAYQVLISSEQDPDLFEDDAPIFSSFRKIESADIKNDSITGTSLGILSAENFKNMLFANDVKPGSIQTANIEPLNITAAKIAANSISIEKIGLLTNMMVSLRNQVNNETLNLNHYLKPTDFSFIDDGAVTQEKIKPAAVRIFKRTTNNITKIVTPFVEGQRFIEGKHLKDGFIDSLKYFYGGNISPTVPLLFLQGKFTAAQIKNCVNQNYVYLNRGDLIYSFQADVLQAFDSKGVT